MTTTQKRKTFLDFFPAPKFLLLSTAGIAVTDESITFVELKRTLFGDGFSLESAERKDLPEGAIKAGEINRPEDTVSILKELASRYGIRYASASLPDEKAYLFTAKIDQVPHEGLRDAVGFILEENAPVSLADSVFDFDIISRNRATGEVRVVVSVLPKNVVSAYESLFKSAGITPISFDLESQAIARAVVRPEDKKPVLIINSSERKTGLYVVDEGAAQFSTIVTHTFSDDSSYADLDELRSEARKVIDFWNARADGSRRHDRKIERVILCGAKASVPEFVEKLMSEMGISYELANAWSSLSSKGYAPKIPLEHSLDYISAIGLVLPRGE